MRNTNRFRLIEQFQADGIRFMFGNPGTVEEGFLDAVSAYPDFQYIETLQEGVAVGAADGYARATHRPALVQLHSGVGLANGISLMYQAKRGHSPLVVVAGEAGLAYDAMDAQNAANLVDIARPVVKYAARIVHPASVLRTIRRAIKMAATPPMGPVFVSLPMDVLDAECTETIVPSSIPDTRVTPDPQAIDKVAGMLLAARNPLFIVGDGIAFSGAEAELHRLAHAVGATVFGADYSEPNFPANDPLYGGLLSHMWGFANRKITAQADVVLVVGTYLFPEVFPSLEGVFAPGAKVISVDLDAYEIGKNFPFDVGLLADAKRTLDALAARIEAKADDSYRAAAADRVALAAQKTAASREAQIGQDRAVRDAVPLKMSRFGEELAPFLDENTVIFDEAITNSDGLSRYVLPSRPGSYYLTRGGSLGVGFPGALGVKLARPNQTVIGFAGDGGAMYTMQALWTAAHHGINCKFVVCNNRSYNILKLNLDQYWNERDVAHHEYPSSFSIKGPDLQFAVMARSMGVAGERVARPAEIRPAIERMLTGEFRDQPYLIDLALEG